MADRTIFWISEKYWSKAHAAATLTSRKTLCGVVRYHPQKPATEDNTKQKCERCARSVHHYLHPAASARGIFRFTPKGDKFHNYPTIPWSLRFELWNGKYYWIIYFNKERLFDSHVGYSTKGTCKRAVQDFAKWLMVETTPKVYKKREG